MTLLVRDEEDIVKQNLDFHLSQGIDFFIITNNRSVDRTPEIVADYEQAGLAEVIYEGSNQYRQAEWVTRMAQKAARQYRADWIINNDADEFWFGTNGPLKSVLRSVPRKVAALKVRRHQFAPPHSSDTDLPWWQSMVYREREPRNYLGNALPPKVCHRADARIEVGAGSHRVSAPRKGTPLNISKASNLEIAHFPIRGLARLEASLRCVEHIFREWPPCAGQTPGAAQYKLYDLLQAGRLGEFYEQRQPELSGEGELSSTESYIKDVRIRDMIDKLGS